MTRKREEPGRRASWTRAKEIKTLVLVLGLALGILVLALPAPEGLSVEGARCLGIAVICFTLWICQPIPLAATGLLALILLPAFRIAESSRVFSFFGNSAVFFLLGVFILSGAVIRTGLSKRIAFLFLDRFGHSPRGILFGVTFTCALFAHFMPEHAVAAMMFPVVLEVATSLRLERGKSVLGKSLFLALAWGSVAGGIGTYLGGARVPLAVEILKEAYGRNIDFLTWAAAAVPISLTLTVLVYFALVRAFPSEVTDVSASRLFLESELQRMGRISKDEVKTAAVAVATVLFWIFAGERAGLALISMASAVSIFALRVVRWNDIIDYVNWGVIVMYGGAIALGKALAETQAVDWLVTRLLGTGEVSPWLLLVILSALALLITEVISNAAAVVILLPLSFGFVGSLGVSPELLTLAVTIPAGLAFCLPIGTPPNAIGYASGFYSIRDSLFLGAVINVLAWSLVILAAFLYWPLLGFRL